MTSFLHRLPGLPDGHPLNDIYAERQRQISTEGWTAKHDDDHGRGELAAAASCYALAASEREGSMAKRTSYQEMPPRIWPWDLKWWKPSSARRELVKAGALIVAEIERLDRGAQLEAEAFFSDDTR